MKRIFYVDEVRDWIRQYDKEEISLSKFVEILNEKATGLSAVELYKLEAAENVVSNSILHGWTTEAKVEYIRQILPDHYEVKESKQKGNVHCKSSVGIQIDDGWDCFMDALKQRFPDFSEVFHNTCHNHVDFTVYFSSKVV